MSLRSSSKASLLASSLAVCALACGNPAPTTSLPPVPGAQREVTFSGMCDASGAVPLSAGLFAVADDEGNVLRIYDADQGGAALASVDLSDGLNLPPPKSKAKARKKAPGKPRRAPETDLEAATRIGDLAFWLTSHARNRSGKRKPERHRLFATALPREGRELAMVGAPYETLFRDLVADPRFAGFGLEQAAELAPKASGGLNIEGMTERSEGGVLIGLRNPVPSGKALLVALLNPVELIHGERPRFGDPVALDLGGLGVSALSFWRGRYLIAAGHYAGGVPSQLYTWDGARAAERVSTLDFSRFNPEAFFTPDERDEILVLSDDGSLPVDGTACKKLRDARQKRFRGVWVSLPRVS